MKTFEVICSTSTFFILMRHLLFFLSFFFFIPIYNEHDYFIPLPLIYFDLSFVYQLFLPKSELFKPDLLYYVWPMVVAGFLSRILLILNRFKNHLFVVWLCPVLYAGVILGTGYPRTLSWDFIPFLIPAVLYVALLLSEKRFLKNQ